MIHNHDLATAINADRYRRGDAHREIADVATHDIRRSVGRWLEHLGKRLQGPPHPTRA
jgi:hypothetical protein